MPSVTARLLAVAAAVVVATGILMWWITPSRLRWARLRPATPPWPRGCGSLPRSADTAGLAVALVDQGQVRFAGVGDSGNASAPQVTEATAFEIGSVAKPLTGMLLADLGIAGDTTSAGIYPRMRFDDPDTAAITLDELASHRSGLPRLPTAPVWGRIRPGWPPRAIIALWRGRWLPTSAGDQSVWLRWLSAAVSFGPAAVLVTLMAA